MKVAVASLDCGSALTAQPTLPCIRTGMLGREKKAGGEAWSEKRTAYSAACRTAVGNIRRRQRARPRCSFKGPPAAAWGEQWGEGPRVSVVSDQGEEGQSEGDFKGLLGQRPWAAGWMLLAVGRGQFGVLTLVRGEVGSISLCIPRHPTRPWRRDAHFWHP